MKLHSKSKQKINFWFNTVSDLEEVSKRFSALFGSYIIDIDFENIYEWSQQIIGDIYVNISRNHTKFRCEAPVLIFFEDYVFSDEQVKTYGLKLSKEFQTTVYRGENILQPDDELLILKTFEIYD